MQNKFCRICWNTAGWRVPMGDRIETGDSYVATHGFGHEEWLFNYEWLIEGFRYGFLQPIGKYLHLYSGHHPSIILYTITPDKEILLIGRINHTYIPEIDELQNVLSVSTKRGWLDQMRADVYRIDGSMDELENPEPTAIANVRFRPEDVEIFDPRPRVIGDHTIVRSSRYHPFNWNDNYPATEIQPPPFQPTDPRRSEHGRTRAAQEAGIADPKHIRLQNRLYEHFCSVYGRDKVLYEHDYVDLILTLAEGNVFFEIKIEPTAKRCIRLALGQLLEYAHYPELRRAKRLVVVGDAPLRQDDRAYLDHLRRTFHLPIYYSRFQWENNELAPEA